MKSIRTLIICFMILLFFGQSSSGEAGNGKKQIYVSTIGLPFYPKEAEDGKKDFLLYRIDSMEKGDRFLKEFFQRIEITDRNKNRFGMLQRVLSIRNYKKEYAYLLISPISRGIKIEQPYYFKGEKSLSFDVIIENKMKDQNLFYIRIYTVDINKDIFNKVIIQNGINHELSMQEP